MTDVHTKGLLAVGTTEKTQELVDLISRNKSKDFGREADLDVRTDQATLNISQDYLIKIVEEIIENAQGRRLQVRYFGPFRTPAVF